MERERAMRGAYRRERKREPDQRRALFFFFFSPGGERAWPRACEPPL